METMTQEAHVTAAPFNRLEHGFVGVLYLLFCLFGLASNLMTAVVFYKDAKLARRPWIHIFLAITNMAVVLPSPFPASSSFSGKWLYGETLCQFYAFEGMMVGIMAIGFVVALCMERYVVGPRNTNDKTGWFYWAVVILNASNGLFWACMPLLGWSKYDLDPAGTSCCLNWKNPDDSYISYLITLEVLSFSLPLGLALLCLFKSSSSAAGAAGVEPKQGSSGSLASPHEVSVDENLPGITEDQMQKLCYVFLVLVMLGWGPFAFLCTLAMFSSSASEMSMLAASIPPLACKLMTSAYPIAYAIISPRFRSNCHSLFRSSEQKNE